MQNSIKIMISGWLCYSLFINSHLLGQASKCECKINGKTADYVFQHSSMGDKCLMFIEKDASFYLCRGCSKGKILTLSLPKTQDLGEMVAWLDGQKKQKLSPQEAVFIYEGLKSWEKAKKMIGFQTTASGLGYKIEKQGSGKKPEKGKKVKVHYKGMLEDGTVFDSSYERGQPFEFDLGMGRVIKGWDEGIPLFNVGGKGVLKIPAELGYGKNGAGNIIPPNATLIFEVEIISAE